MNKKMQLWAIVILSSLFVTSCSNSDDDVTPEDNGGGNKDITAVVTYDGTGGDFDVTGDYIAGTTLDQSHCVRVYANITQKGKYYYETKTVNGYKFVANEDFQTLGQSTLYFYGQGTPENSGEDTFEFMVGDKMHSKTISVYAEGSLNQENMVVIGCGTPHMRDTYTFALDGKGELLWSKTGRSKTFAIKNNKAYGVIDDILYCLNPLSGETEWSVPFKLWAYVRGVSIDENYLYLGNDEGLHAVNQADGSIAWTYQPESFTSSQPSTPVVTENTIYLHDRNLVLAVSKDGTKVWEYDLGDLSNGSLAIEGDVIFTNCENGELTALNKTDGQTVLWTKTIGRAFYASPTIANGKVYIQGESKFYCLDAVNGNEIWSIAQETNYNYSSPIVDGDMIYVNALEQGIMAYNATNGELIWEKANKYAGSSYGAVIYDEMIVDCGTSGVALRKKSDGEGFWTYGEYSNYDQRNKTESHCSAVVYNTETNQAYYSSDSGNTLF